VRDRLRREVVGPQPGAFADELGDNLAPGGEPQGGVREQRGHSQDQLHPPPVQRHLLGRDPVEVDEREPDRVHERHLGRAGLQPDAHPVKLGLERAPRHVILRREVPEERPSPDPGRRRDLVHRGLLEPALREQGERRVLELGAGGHPLPAGV
jgi:hypothetical protein